MGILYFYLLVNKISFVLSGFTPSPLSLAHIEISYSVVSIISLIVVVHITVTRMTTWSVYADFLLYSWYLGSYLLLSASGEGILLLCGVLQLVLVFIRASRISESTISLCGVLMIHYMMYFSIIKASSASSFKDSFFGFVENLIYIQECS